MRDRLLNDHLALGIVTVVMFSIAALYEQRKELALRHISSLEAAKRAVELERLRALNEVQLARAERLAALGRVAAATAHEINNPLTYISGNLQVLAETAARQRRNQLVIADALEGVASIKRIVADMRLCAPAGEDEDQMGHIVVASAVARAVELAAPHTRGRGRVEVALDVVPPVLGDETRLVQLLLNLIANAAQALPEGAPDAHVIHIAARHEDTHVVIEVADDGRGIPAEILDRVKEPFFTTRDVGDGVGLGLALADGIARSFGGAVALESRPGRTVARVTLLANVPGGQPTPRLIEQSRPDSAGVAPA